MVPLVRAETRTAHSPSLIRVSDVVPESVQWLWWHRIPRGKLTIIDGDPGLGKSLITLDFAARLSAGKEWPNGEATEPANVLLMACEDGIADTIRPRLEAAGANLERVLVLSMLDDGQGRSEMPELPRDIDLLRSLIEDNQIQLLIVDPITAYLPPDKVKANSDQDVRRVLTQLSVVAGQTGAAIIAIRHLNKGVGQRAIYRGVGSIAFAAVARMVWIVAAHPDDSNRPESEQRGILSRVKGNIAPPVPALVFRREGVHLSSIDEDVPRIVWCDEAWIAADLAVAYTEKGNRPSKVDDAVAFLHDLLDDGEEVRQTTIDMAAEERGISRSSLNRAKTALSVTAKKRGFRDQGYWTWRLPKEITETKDSQHPQLSTFGESDHLRDSDAGNMVRLGDGFVWPSGRPGWASKSAMESQ